MKNKASKKKKPTRIGQMTNSRGDWGSINPVTRVVQNKKGKGSYNRQKDKKAAY